MPGGVPDIPGEPDGLRSAAAQLDACGGRAEGLASAIAATGEGMAGGWSGMAAMAAMGACAAAAEPLATAGEGFSTLSQALRRYASELEDAQRDADRAREQLAAAKAAAATATGLLVELSAEEDPEPTSIAHLQGRLDQAQDDATSASAAGQAAFERAKAAAHAAAASFEAVGGSAPTPPPPPPPPRPAAGGDGDQPGWFEKAAGDAWGGLKAAGGFVADKTSDGWEIASNTGSEWNPMSPAFMTDAAEGAAGVIAGTGSFLWQGVKASETYRRYDPEGSDQARQQFREGFAYAWDHPWETGKAMLGVHHLENGEPGKLAGEAGLAALLTVATGGAGAATRVTSGVSRATTAGANRARAAAASADAAIRMRHATKVDDLRALGRQDYSGRLPDEVDNFTDPGVKPVTGARDTDEWVVGFGDASRKVGEGRSAMWWVPLDEARGYGTLENLRDNLALPYRWTEDGSFQPKDEAVLMRIPAGTETTRLEGTAGPQPRAPDPRPGGGTQIAFREVDLAWVEARMHTADLLEGRLPRGVPR